VADLRRSLDKARNAVKGSTGYAAVKDDLDSLEASYASLERIQKAAQEGKVADVLEPAIAGFQVTGAILNTRLAKSEAAIGALTDLLKRDASTAEMDRFNREMDINNALMDLAKGPYALLGGAIGLLAKSSPPEVRRRTFTALATTLPAVAFGRPALEQAIRTCHDEEDDEATRSGFATTMARLAVPLVAPSAETKPAPGAASPSPTT
jgi:hypothetical protein